MPTAIIISAGIEPACQLTNGTTTTTYSTTATNSTGFNWSLSDNTAGTIDQAGVMTWANGYSGTVNIQVTANGCNGPSPMIIRTVIVNTGPTPTLTGPGSPCAGSTGNVYITQSGMTGYNWIISAGGVITAGGGITDTSVTVTWNTSGPQSVSVSYTGANGCIATAPAIFNVTVNPDLPVSVSITASANPFCQGERYAVTISSIPKEFFLPPSNIPYFMSRSLIKYLGRIS